MGTTNKRVKPVDDNRYPKYRSGASAELYDPIGLADALKSKVVMAARDKYESCPGPKKTFCTLRADALSVMTDHRLSSRRRGTFTLALRIH